MSNDKLTQQSVRIMMATYNGEKYIEEQIQSICSQTYDNWSLIIQDDDSKDGTWEIIERYATIDNRITVKKSPEVNHGVYFNFNSIANQEKASGIKYDYYMFCDQDDIWDADKIEKLLELMTKNKYEGPALLYGDMRAVNERGEVIINSVVSAQGLRYHNCCSLFFANFTHGCNLIMNNATFFSVPIINTNEEIVGMLPHDSLYTKFAGVFGKIEYVPDQMMSYRRHDKNSTSKQEYGDYSIKRILKRICKIGDLAKDHARTYNQSLLIIQLMKKCGYYNDAINKIESIIYIGGFKALIWMRRNNINCGNIIKTVSHKIIILLGIYKKYLFDKELIKQLEL